MCFDLDDDLGDCLCNLLMCVSCCYLCKKCCGCEDQPRPQTTHQTIYVQQPLPGQMQQQPMYDPSQGQFQPHPGNYPLQQPVYYPPQQSGYPQQQGFPPQHPGYAQPMGYPQQYGAQMNPEFQQMPQPQGYPPRKIKLKSFNETLYLSKTMSQTSASSSVLKLYQLVIEDVVTNVRDAFLDEGVDEAVLQEMKQIWTNRLMASKAVEVTPEPQTPQSQPVIMANNPKANGTKSKKSLSGEQKNNVPSSLNGNAKGFSGIPPLAPTMSKGNLQTAKNLLQPAIKSEPGQATASSSQSSQNGPPALQTTLDPNKLIPIQITLPPQANETDNRVLTIKVPARAIQENQLQQVITGEIITSIMPLQPSVASAVLQRHVTSVLEAMSTKSNAIKVSRQVDGTAGDTSDEDGSDISDDHFDDLDDDDLNKDEDGSDINDIEGGAEEEPLNSEDDVTDEDAADLFETDNVVVCQYDKINRSRNKWKFYLKDGIMSLGGKDYVFQKSNGDAEW
ncbi:CLUMA_CG003244, isoform A [Clunio marinus]|uniref:CLUMA_CG003244, isoform A n=1 Tax=Clunio marinus TaxID=568069 RepID=A0A1J1HQE5_9DIPT|nr:CLUMA_CG003244, isoform A [Clunio marinus]